MSFCHTATLDIVLSFNAWRSLKITQVVRFLLKFVIAAFWVVFLPVCYFRSVQNPTAIERLFSSWTGAWWDQSFYNYAVAIYLIPNILATLLFILPPMRRNMERSNIKVIVFLMWWAQVSLSSSHHSRD